MAEGAADQRGELLVSRDDGVTRLVLNRPHKGNALSSALVARIHEAIAEACEQATRLLVLSAEGRHFCTGFDLSDLASETDDSLLARFTRLELMLQALHGAPFPTLALVHGRAMGAGADMVCACAERWMVEDATFAFPGAGFGLVLGTARLSDAVGARTARRWVETGVSIPAQEALEAGLVQRKVAPDALSAELAVRCAAARRLDDATHGAVHAATEQQRRPRGASGAASDLLALVQSAARSGLQARIRAYTQGQLRK